MLQWARRRNHVLPYLVGLVGISFTITVLSHSPLFSLILLSITLFFVYLEVVTQWSFRAPARRKPELRDPMWKRLSVEVNGLNIIHYLRQGRDDAPLAWVVHGWTSGSMRMLQRAD